MDNLVETPGALLLGDNTGQNLQRCLHASSEWPLPDNITARGCSPCNPDCQEPGEAGPGHLGLKVGQLQLLPRGLIVQTRVGLPNTPRLKPLYNRQQ